MVKLLYQGLVAICFIAMGAFLLLSAPAKSAEITKQITNDSVNHTGEDSCLFTYTPKNSIPKYSVSFSYNGHETVISTMIPGVDFSEVAYATGIVSRLIDSGEITPSEFSVLADETGTRNLLQIKVEGNITHMIGQSYGLAFIIYFKDNGIDGETFYRLFWPSTSALKDFQQCSANIDGYQSDIN